MISVPPIIWWYKLRMHCTSRKFTAFTIQTTAYALPSHCTVECVYTCSRIEWGGALIRVSCKWSSAEYGSQTLGWWACNAVWERKTRMIKLIKLCWGLAVTHFERTIILKSALNQGLKSARIVHTLIPQTSFPWPITLSMYSSATLVAGSSKSKVKYSFSNSAGLVTCNSRIRERKRERRLI